MVGHALTHVGTTVHLTVGSMLHDIALTVQHDAILTLHQLFGFLF